jgi:hypothetical protein
MESYHVEVLCLRIFDGVISDYPWAVFQFFDKAVTLVKSPLSYEGGYADDYLDNDFDRKEVLRRLEAARDKALTAWHLTHDERSEHEKAIAIWRQIFGDKFPAYG